MNRFLILLMSISLLISSCENRRSSLKIVNTRVEYSQNPIDVDKPEPRFSWQLDDSLRGVVQTSYMVLVASVEKNLTEKKADIWNSGWQISDQNIFVTYQGEKLLSGKKYFWTVKVKDNLGRISTPEELSTFRMAKLNREDWQAEWIAWTPKGEIATPSATPRSILMRKEFLAAKNLDHALAYVTGLGNYVLYLNGEKAGNDFLSPGWTDYRKRVQYQVYDITSVIQEGDNSIGIMLGNMWWSGGLGWQGGQVYSKGPLCALVQLELYYKDGTMEIVSSNEEWKASLSPVVDNTPYHGEIWDASLEIPGWSTPGFMDNSWANVEKINMDSLILSAQTDPEIRIADEIIPVSVNEVKPGIFVFDLGFNMVGTERIHFKGKAGDTIKLRFAELLHEDGTVAQENLRSARATDMYIPSADGEFTWQPSFTYHGYQYVQVEGLAEKPSKEDFTGLRFYSSADVTGSFECSNDILNQVWKNILNGQKGNMMSVPTDCPQRDERLGWTGDAQIFGPTACYNMNMNRFFAKWVRDITDSQHKDGYTFDVNPAIVVGGPAKAAWGDAVSIVPWTLYKFYGDTRVLEDNYEGIKAWVEYMKRKSVNYIYEWKQKGESWEGYGDWIAVEHSPVEPISAAYFYHSTRILSDIAGILDYNDDASEYKALSDSIYQAFNRKFFDTEKINYPGKTQTANLLPLGFGLTPEGYREKVIGNVAENVILKGKHPTTGFLGTAYLLPLLSDYGYHQLAYETAISEEYPSWGYMVKKGASSMWELWNSDTERPEGMNSRNHFALGSVGEWYFTHLAGIRPDEPGFKKLTISPMPAEGLDFVNAQTECPYGKISSAWKRMEGGIEMEISIPANTSAKIVIPTPESLGADPGHKFILSANGKILENGQQELPEGILSVSSEGKGLSIGIMSGTYKFIFKPTE